MPNDESERLIANILGVFSRTAPVTNLEQLAARNVYCKMDRLRLNMGRDGLQTWFHYMHKKMRIRDCSVDIQIDTIAAIGSGQYDVCGSAVSEYSDGSVEKQPIKLSYLIEDGKISGIWSKRSNYVCVLGRSIEFPLYIGFMYHCLRAWLYRISGLRASLPRL
jgi:hypothetical protein